MHSGGRFEHILEIFAKFSSLWASSQVWLGAQTLGAGDAEKLGTCLLWAGSLKGLGKLGKNGWNWMRATSLPPIMLYSILNLMALQNSWKLWKLSNYIYHMINVSIFFSTFVTTWHETIALSCGSWWYEYKLCSLTPLFINFLSLTWMYEILLRWFPCIGQLLKASTK